MTKDIAELQLTVRGKFAGAFELWYVRGLLERELEGVLRSVMRYLGNREAWDVQVEVRCAEPEPEVLQVRRGRLAMFWSWLAGRDDG